MTLANSRGSATRVLVLPPEGVMEKTIEVNQSETVNGITITLERVELTATEARFYAFYIPSDYDLPRGPDLPPPSLMFHAEAEYRLDDGRVIEAGLSGIRFLDNGMIHSWDRYLDPVPQGTRELTFVITSLAEQDGPWEFKIPLE